MKKTSYNKAFKEHAVTLWLSSGKSATEIGRDLGIKPERLYTWKEAVNYQPAQPNSGVAPRPRTARELEQELAQLQRENHMLRQQRDILKKTLGILSEPPSSALSGSKS
jgi:transposase-like protein